MTSSVAVSPDGANVYVAAAAGDAITVFRRDRAGRSPVRVTSRSLPYRIFGGPSPPTRVLPDDELDARDSVVVRRFARITDQDRTADEIVGSSAARHRELTACLDVWAGAPEAVAVTQLSALYEVALASRGAIARDRGLRRTLNRLRAIEGVQRLAPLRMALRVLDQDRQRARAIADATLDTCSLLRQWQASRWNAHQPPPAIIRIQRLLQSPARRGTEILARAAQLIAHHGGAHARAAAEAVKHRVDYPQSAFPPCDRS